MSNKKMRKPLAKLIVIVLVLSCLYTANGSKSSATMNYYSGYAHLFAGFSFTGSSANRFMGGKTECTVRFAEALVSRKKINISLAWCEKSIGNVICRENKTVKLKGNGAVLSGSFSYDAGRSSFLGRGKIWLDFDYGEVYLMLGGEPGAPLFAKKRLSQV